MSDPFSVVFFQRKPLPIHKSLEFIFDDVRKRLPTHITPIKWVFTRYSQGIAGRLRIIWEAKTHQSDVNHVTGDIHFATLLLKRKKTMLTVHDCGLLSTSTGLKHAVLKYFWFTLPLKKCSLVTVVSKATERELLKYVEYDRSRIKVVPVAISLDFTHHPKPFNPRPVILQVGVTANKNLERLIQALAGVDCHLRIIGALPEAIERQLVESKISFSTAKNLSHEALIQEYVNCDLISFVSTYEGFGMPIVEGNAVGRAVVTSNILSMPEVAGEAACLVDPFSVDEIRKGILRVIQDGQYREQLVSKGLENCKRFDPQKIAGMYLALYELLRNESKK